MRTREEALAATMASAARREKNARRRRVRATNRARLPHGRHHR